MGYILRIVGGDLDGHVVIVPSDQPITLGRGSNNDVQIHDKKLSRTHCQVMVSRGKCVVTDLNSTNGTYVGGERIEERALSPGDVITMGMITLKVAFREEEAPTEEASAVAYCVECGKPISQASFDAAKAKVINQRAYCEECRAGIAAPAAEEEPESEETVPVEIDLDLAAGERFAGYTIGEQLRSTLYGTQFRAAKKELSNPVMLTLLRAMDPEWANKFLHAYYQTGALVHPNILLLYETGEDEGRFYFSTEFVQGQTLEELLAARGPIPHTEASNLVDQVGHAISYALEKHIPHGTLAPCNMYVTADRACKVADFGLASLPPTSPAVSPFALSLMPYRAPEQLRQRTMPSIECEIYALGAILYHMLSGKPPFQGTTMKELRDKILDAKPQPLASLAPNLPEFMVNIVERCMATSPTGRYQTPRELIADLEQSPRSVA